MTRLLIESVWLRANNCCEYCQMPQQYTDATHEIDHIIARKHHGETVSENLCLACFSCNNGKAANLTGIDLLTGLLTRLFHPRHDEWSVHFRWEGPYLIGLNAIGRVTVDVLNINNRYRVLHRQALIDEGVFPST